MKAKYVVLIVFAVLFSVSTFLYADSESAEGRPYLGVVLDESPLPELLAKHLGLSPGQGIRIRNVQRDSAADKAGLERDDIIIAFEGKIVEDNEQFVEAVREAGVDKEVSLEIIHLGQRKKIKLKLGQFKGGFDPDDWKYPLEPEIMQSWRPGKVFRLKPGDKDWMEIQFDKIPGIKDDLGKLFKEMYRFQHTDNGEKYDITIDGNPEDENTSITIRVSGSDSKITEYQTTVKEIDKLPEKYRRSVIEDIAKAQKKSREKKLFNHKVPPAPPEPEVWRRYFDSEKFQPRQFDYGERMEKRFRDLQERLERLEKRQEDMLDRRLKDSNRQKSLMQPDNEKEKVSI